MEDRLAMASWLVPSGLRAVDFGGRGTTVSLERIHVEVYDKEEVSLKCL